MTRGPRRLAARACLAVVVALLLLAVPAAADDGWVIDRFASDIEIQRDGTLVITESIEVDFLALQDRHGIFRVIPVRYQWDPDPKMLRIYDVDVRSVLDANGRSLTYETSEGGGPNFGIRIGDADRIVTGKQTYRINYTVRGALNAFAASGHRRPRGVPAAARGIGCPDPDAHRPRRHLRACRRPGRGC